MLLLLLKQHYRFLLCIMAEHNDTGNIGENYAVQFMIKRGFKILHRNWRFGHYEVDLIADGMDKLHFIEVKTRKKHGFGHPEDAVTKTKLKHMIQSANHFLYLYPHWNRIQFDILSISIYNENKIEYYLIEDISL